MKDIKIEKVTLNIGVGEPGANLDKAMKLLSSLSGAKPIQTTSKKRIPSWNIRPGLAIATKVTLRKNKAKEILLRLLAAVNNELKSDSFDNEGNFSFGIKEYLDIPDAKYDADIGIIGLDVAVTLTRPGFRVKKKRIRRGKIPRQHRISKEEATEFMKKEFKVIIK